MKRFLLVVLAVATILFTVSCVLKAGESNESDEGGESGENNESGESRESGESGAERSADSGAPSCASRAADSGEASEPASAAAVSEDSGGSSEDGSAEMSADSGCASSEESSGGTESSEASAASEPPVVPPVSEPPVSEPPVSEPPVSEPPVVPPVSEPPVSEPPAVPPGVWFNDLKNQQSRDRHGFSDAELDAYFDGALYVGDSVAQGLKHYRNMYEKDIFKNMIFNTGAAYGYHNCLSPISEKSLHPIYQGAKRTIWDMVALTGAKRVFIGFGLNDFGYATPASLKKCLDKIRANISAVSPDAEVIILSAGNFTRDGESYVPEKNDYRTCARHRDYNQYILEYCNEAGLDYIDVTNCFADDYGYLPKESSMDNYCHPKIELYTVWRDILYGYAADKLLGTYRNPPRMK